MTIDDVKDLLNVFYVAYPHSYSNWKSYMFDLSPKIWHRYLANIPKQFAMDAADKYLCSDAAFAPTIGQIMTIIRNDISKYDCERQWDLVLWIVRNVSENLHEAPKKYLDEIAQGLVNERYLRKLKGDSKLVDVEHHTFIKRYNEEKERLEFDAISTGNIMQIASEQKLRQIASEPRFKAIEHKEE